MEFLGVPGDFGSVYGELIYTIKGNGNSGVIDAEVMANGLIAGIKRFADDGQSTGVNAAGYLKGYIDTKPAKPGVCRFILPEGRTVKAAVRAGGIVSPERVFVGSAAAHLDTMALLSGLPAKRVLYEDEYDELSFAVEGGQLAAAITVGRTSPFPVAVANIQATKGIATLVVDAAHIAAVAASAGKNFEDCATAKITITAAGSTVAQVEYELRRRSAGQVRLAWVNKYGTVDYYTFATIAEERTQAEKERIKLENGYKTVTVNRTKSDTLISEYVTPETAHRLAQIVCTEKAWRIDNDGYSEVEITTDSVTTTYGLLASVSLTVRLDISE